MGYAGEPGIGCSGHGDGRCFDVLGELGVEAPRLGTDGGAGARGSPLGKLRGASLGTSLKSFGEDGALGEQGATLDALGEPGTASGALGGCFGRA